MPVKNKDLPPSSVCARCAARFPTCCRLRSAEGDGNADWEGECFPLSEAELERLQSAVRALPDPPAEELAAGAPNSPEFLAAMRALFPGQAEQLAKAYPAGGQHRRMSLRPDGSCVCLTAQGCCLPRESRPWFCRLFPLWINRGRLACFTPADCLAVLESRSLPELLRAFGGSEGEVRRLFESLRRDWGLLPAD